MSKSPSLRRIQADIRELSIDPSDRYHAAPLENDMFEWHFTIRGADGTDFEGGYYHGRILLPADYPFKPPNIVFLTPSGRFETNVKVCLSFSAYHPELWQPAWGIRLILEALVSFLPTRGDGAIGALDWTSEERKKLAKKSLSYTCPLCGNCAAHMKAIEARILKKRKNHSGKGSGSGSGSGGGKFQKEIEQLHAMQLANEGGNEKAAATMDGNGDGDSDGDGDNNDGNGNNNEKEKGAEEKAETETETMEIEKEPVMEEPKKQDEVAAADTNIDTDTEKGQENSKEEKADEPEPAGQDNDNDEKPTVIDEPPAEKQTNVILDAEAKTEYDEEPVPDTTGAVAVAGTGTETEKEMEPKQIPPPQDEGEDPTEGQGQQPLQAQPAEVAAAAAPEAAAAGEIQSLDSPLLSDPVVHTGIVIFGIIVYLLVQKIRAIVEDMRELEALFHRE